MRIDLHTHSSVSDGTDDPATLVAKAYAAGLDVVALTDHDTYAGLPAALAAGERHGIEVVPGMEMSTRHRGRSVHLLVYGDLSGDEAVTAELARIRGGRGDRLRPVLDKLAALGMDISESEVMAQVGQSPSIGRPHIADALVAKGFVADRTEAFDRFLADGGPAHVERYATELVDAITLVRAAGGVPVIAHPWGRGSAAVLAPDVLTGLVAGQGLAGFEVDHQDHDATQRAELRALADRLGCLGTGSSDYHGLGKSDHELGCNTTTPQTYARLRALMGH